MTSYMGAVVEILWNVGSVHIPLCTQTPIPFLYKIYKIRKLRKCSVFPSFFQNTTFSLNDCLFLTATWFKLSYMEYLAYAKLIVLQLFFYFSTKKYIFFTFSYFTLNKSKKILSKKIESDFI